MSNGVIVMEEGDRKWIKELFDASLKPIIKEVSEIKDDMKERFNQLPCKDHSTKITQIETRQVNGKEHAKEKQAYKRDYRDLLLKVAIGVITLIGALEAIGFFQGLSKGK